jgi:phospholipase/lecithinase/hemolysin
MLRLAAVLVALLLALPAAAKPFDRLLVFGDSLSDPGNLFAITSFLNGQGVPGVDPFPPPPYVGGRFSDGPVWVEGLAAGLGLGSSVVTNLATGGARMLDHAAYEDVPPEAVPALQSLGVLGVRQQIGAYLTIEAPVPANSLVVVWGGANDFVNGRALDPNAPSPLLALVDGLHALIGAGAKNLLVPNLPDIGDTPRFRTGPQSGELSAGTAAFNAGLAAALDDVRANSDAHVFELDVAGLLRNAGAYGLTNLTVPCIALADVPGACAGSLYFDDLHPTAVVHGVLAHAALAAVPLPAGMVLFGTALVGLGLLRRRIGPA